MKNSNGRSNQLTALALALVLAVSARQSMATVYDWVGTTSTSWATLTNWSVAGATPGVLPGAGDTVRFNSLAFTNAPALDQARSVLGITVAGTQTKAIGISGAFVLSIGTSGIDMSAATSTSNLTFTNTSITLLGAQSWTANTGTLITSTPIANGGFLLTTAGAGNVTFGGIISGTGALTISGTGTTTLSAANTYSGGSTISGAGTVAISNAASFGTVGVTISAAATIQSTATVVTTNAIAANSDFTVGGTTALTLGALTLNASRIITNNNTTTLTSLGAISGATFNLTFSGNGSTTVTGIIGTTSGTLTKNGTGTLTLNGANTYTGVTTINAGILKAGNAAALGTVAGGTTVVSGATLDVGGQNLGLEPFTLNGTGVGGNGAVINTGADQINALAVVTLGADTSIGGPGRIDIRKNGTTATINQAGFALSTSSTSTYLGIVDLSATVSNPGAINITNGIVSIEIGTNLGATGTITVGASGVLQLYANTVNSRPIVLNGGEIRHNSGSTAASSWSGQITLGTGTININNANTTAGRTLTLSGKVTGSGNLTINGSVAPGIVVFSSATNDFTGVTTLTTGQLSIASISNGGVASALGAATNAAANLVFNGGTLTYSGATASSDRNFTINAAKTATLNVSNAASILTLSGSTPLTTGALNVAGTAGSMLVLSGTNLHTGITTLSSGILAVTTDANLGAATGAAAITFNGGTLQVTGNNTFQTSKGVTMTSAGTINMVNATDVATFNGAFTGVGALTKANLPASTGASNLILTADNSAWTTGAFNIANGWVTIKHSNALGATRAIGLTAGTAGQPQLHIDGTSGNLSIPASVTYNTSSNLASISNDVGNNTIAGTFSVTSGGGDTGITVATGTTLTLTGNISSATTGRTVLLRGDGNGTINSIISDALGALGVSRNSGTGVWTLSGNNTYVGATTVSTGTLIVNGTNTGVSAHTVSAGGILGGKGTIAGSLTVATGGVLIPGDFVTGASTADKLTVNNSVNFQPGSIATFQLNQSGSDTNNNTGFVAGSDFIDMTNATGLLSMGLSTLNISVGGTPLTAPGRYRLINNVGTTATLGSPTVTFTGQTGIAGYLDTVTNAPNVDLIVVPANTKTWTGADFAVNSNWSNANNWSPVGAPVSGDTLIFPQGLTNASCYTSVNDILTTNSTPTPAVSNTVFLNIVLNGTGTDAYVFSGEDIYLSSSGSSINLQAGANQAIANKIVFANTAGTASAAGTVSSSTGLKLTLSGNITGTSLIVGGTGTVSLGGANALSIGASISSGTVQITNAGALGSNALAVNGALDLNGLNVSVASLSSSASTGVITDNSAGVTVTTLTLTNQANGTYSGSINKGATQDIALSVTTTTAGGGLVLSGASNYGGGTTITATRVNTTAATALGAGPVIVNSGAQVYLSAAVTMANAFTISGNGGGAFDLNPRGALRVDSGTLSGQITLNANASIGAFTGSTTGTITGKVTGPFALSINVAAQTGIVKLSNTANDFTGGVSILNGTLLLGAANVIPNGATAGDVTIAAGAALDLANLAEQINGLSGAGQVKNTVAGSPVLTVGDNNATSTFGGTIITGTGQVALTKIGTGALTLNGASTTTASFTLSAGTINLGVAAALGTGTFVISGGTTIDNTSGGALTITNAQTWGGDFTFTGTNNLTMNTGAVAAAAVRQVTVSASTLTVGGVISGAGGITKAGTGTLTLTGANTYTGVTNINGGNLILTGTGLIANTATNTVTINTGGTFTLDKTDTWGNSATGIPLIPIVINAGGTMTNTLTRFNTLGPLTLNGGTLTSAGGNGAQFPSWALRNNVAVGGGAVTSTISNGTAAFPAINLGAGAVTGINITVTSPAILDITAPLQNGSNATNVAQLSTLTLNGSGTTNLRAANTFTGTLAVSTGTVTFGNAAAAGTGTLAFNGGNSTINNSSGSALTLSTNNPITFNNDITFIGTDDLNLGTGAVTLGGNRSITASAKTLTFGGVISGTSLGIIKAGAGNLVLTGANAYTGVTTVNAGTLFVNGASSGTGVHTVASGATLAGSGTISGAVVVNSGGILSPGNLTTSANQLALTGLTLNSGAIVNLELGDTVGNTTFAAGSDFINALATGTVTFNGATINVTYVGGTTFSAGTYRILNNAGTTVSNAFGPVTVPAGFTAYFDTTTSSPNVNLVVSSTTGNRVWSGADFAANATNTNWSNAGNWVGGVAPSAGDILEFPSDAQAFVTTNDTALTYKEIIFSNATNATVIYTVNATLPILLSATTGTIQVATSTGSTTVNVAGAVTAANMNFDVGAGTVLNANGVLTASGGLSLTGTGMVGLNAANTIGTTTLLGSTLNIGNTGAFGTGALVINSGAIDNTTGGAATITNAVTLNGNFTFVGTNNLAINTGAMTLQSNSSVTVAANTLTIGENITGGFRITKLGAGVMTLNGTNASGSVTLNGGTLNLGNATSVGTGQLFFFSGTFDNTSGSTMTFTNNNAVTFGGDVVFTGTNALNFGTGAVNLTGIRQITTSNATNGLTIGGIASGVGGITKAGPGPLVLSGVNTYTGATAINGGTVTIAAATGIGAITNSLSFGGGTLIATATTDLGATRTVDIGAGGGTISAATGLTVTISGVMSGAGTLGFTGGATFTLSNANTFTGNVNVDSIGSTVSNPGTTLKLSNASALTTGTVTVNQGSIAGNSGTTLDVAGVTINGVTAVFNTPLATFRTTLSCSTGTSIWGGNIVLQGVDLTVFNAAGTELRVNGTISAGGAGYTGIAFPRGVGLVTWNGNVNLPAGSVAHTDAGILLVNSTGNTWLNTTVSNGTIKIGANNALPVTTPLTLGQGGTEVVTFDINGFNQTVTSIATNPASNATGAKQVTNNGTTPATFTVNNSTPITFGTGATGGLIASGTGMLHFAKSGSGMLTLTRAMTYTGLTTISSGTLQAGLAAAIPATTTLTIGDDATAIFDMNNFAHTLVGLNGGGTTGGTVSLGTATLTLGNTNGNGSYAGVITGAGNVTKTGAGMQALSSTASTYTGKTTVLNGGLIVSSIGSAGNPGSLGAPTSAFNAIIDLGSTTLPATLRYTGSGETTDRVINLAGTTGGAVLDASGTGAWIINNPLTLTGVGTKPLTLQGTSTAANSIPAIANSSVTGLTSLVKLDSGTWVLAGNNSFTGGVMIANGVLSLNNAGALNSATPNNLLMTGGVLELNGNSVTVGDGSATGFGISAGLGAVVRNNNAAAAVLTVNQTSATSTSFDGVFQDGAAAGSLGLTKTGSGTLLLTNSSTYSGPTNITAGTVRLATSAAFAKTLTNRWSFNGSLNDGVGASNATLLNQSTTGVFNASTLGASQISLAGGGHTQGEFINLGSGLIPKDGSPFTVEFWTTNNLVQQWGRIFDFGSSSTNYITAAFTNATTITQDRIEWRIVAGTTGSNFLDNTMAPYLQGQEYHVAFVIAPGAGPGGTTLISTYIAPSNNSSISARSSYSTTYTLAANIVDTNLWLGQSQFAPDSTTAAQYNEVRFWKNALTLADLNFLHRQGPDASPTNLSVPSSQGSLPSGTDVVISGSGVLDLNGFSQTVKSVTGGSGTNSLYLGYNNGGNSTLTLAGASGFTTSSGSVLNFALPGAPNPGAGGTNGNDYINAGANPVTLNGGIINIAGGVGFTAGVYRLIDGNVSVTTPFVLGSMPVGTSGTLSVVTGVGGHVDLTVVNAETFVWTGNSPTLNPPGNANWTTSGNWTRQSDSSTSAVPTGNAGEILVFPTGPTVLNPNNNFSANTAFGLIRFTGGGYTLTGNSVILSTAGNVIDNQSGANTVNLDVILLGNATVANAGTNLTVGLSTSSLGANNALTLDTGATATTTVNSLISGPGSLSVTGTGVVVLANSGNSYSGGTSINTATLSIAADGAMGAASGVASINGGTLLVTGNTAITSTRGFVLGSGSATFNVSNTSAAGISLGGVISGTTTGIIKTGTGVLAFTNTGNSYIGSTPAAAISVNQGTFVFSNDTHLGNSNNCVVISNGATLSNTTTTSVTLGASRFITMGTGGGTINCTTNSTNGTGKLLLSFANQLRGTGALTKTGNGMIQMSAGNTGNTFSGSSVTIVGGVIEVQNTTAIASTIPITIDNDPSNTTPAELAINNITFANNITISSRGGWMSGETSTATYSGTITINGSLTFGVRQFFTAGTSANSLISSTLTGTGTLTTSNVGLVAGTPGTTGVLILSGNNSTFAGGIIVGTGTTIQIGNAGTAGTLGSGSVQTNGTLSFNRTDAITVANTISGSGALTQAGSGTTTLTGNLIYAGVTNATAGTLVFGATCTSSGSAGIRVGAGIFTHQGTTTIAANGALDDASVGASIAVLTTGTFNQSGGTLTVSNFHANGTNNISGGVMNVSGDFFFGQVNGNSATINQTGGTVNVTTAVGSTLIRLGHYTTGTRTYTLSGGTLDASTADSFNIGWDGGGTMVVGGGAGVATFKASGIVLDAHGSTTTINNTLTVSANGVVEVGASGITAGGDTADKVFLNGGTIRGVATSTWGAIVTANAATTSVINVLSGFTVTQSGIYDATGAGTIQKTGPGTLISSGINTFAGPTQINGGTMLLNGASTGVSAVTVANGATLGGTGTVPGAVSISAGGILSPGAVGAIGKLTMSGGLTFNGVSGTPCILVEQLASGLTTPYNGTAIDQGVVTGAITPGTLVAQVSLPSGVPNVGAYTVLTGTVAVAGSPVYSVGSMPPGFTGVMSTSGNNVIITVSAGTTKNWTGLDGALDTWNTTANWSSLPTGAGGEDIAFPTSATARFATNTNNFTGAVFNSVTINSSTGKEYTLSGNGFTTSALNITSATGNTTIHTPITNAGTTTIAATGGTATFDGNNASWTGPVSINVGTLQIGSGSTSGTLTSGTVTVGTATVQGTLAFNRSDSLSIANNIVFPTQTAGTANGISVIKGVVNFSGVTSGGGTTIYPNLSVGGTAANKPILNINSGASITSRVNVGNGSAAGAVYQSGGTVLPVGQAGNDSFVGSASGNYGFYQLSGGIMTSNAFMSFGNSSATGLFYQTGGTLNVNAGWFGFGYTGTALAPSTGVGYFSGGTATFANNLLQLLNYQPVGAVCEFTVDGGTVSTTTNTMQIGNAAGAFSGTVALNLKSGTLITANINRLAITATTNISFNGGTFRPSANQTLNVASTNAYVYSSNAIVDTSLSSYTIGQALLQAPGGGVTGIAVTTAGAGYIAPPYVKITGGGGSGATAVAIMADDLAGTNTFKVSSIVITSPGINYTSAPTVSLVGGGTPVTAAVLATPTFATNANGNLVKVGANTLTLTGANTYAGATNIQNGTLTMGANNTLPSTTTVNLGTASTNGILDVGAFSNQVSAVLVASGAIANSQFIGNSSTTANGTLVINNPGSTTYTGLIIDRLGAGTKQTGLTLTGGTLTLTSANTYTGATLVSGGTLVVNGSSSSPHTASGTGTLSGTGTISGAVTVQSGGTINPGDPAVNSGIGKITIGNGAVLNLNAGGNVTFQLSASPATSYTGNNDFIDASGSQVNLAGATLNITGTPAVGRYRLISAAGLTGSLSIGSAPSGFSFVVDTVTNAPNVEVVVSTASAFVWTGNGFTDPPTNTIPDPNWSNANNWQGLVAPTAIGSSTAQLTFPSGAAQMATTNNDLTGAAFNSVTFSGGAYTVSGNGFGVIGSLAVTSGTHTINVDLSASGASAQISNTSGATLTIGSTVNVKSLTASTGNALAISSGASSPVVINNILAGSGAVLTGGASPTSLNANSTFSGVLTVAGGSTFNLGNGTNGNLGSGSTVVALSGSTVNVNLVNNATLPSNFTNAGTVNFAIVTPNQQTLSGVLSGAGAYTQTGTGTTVLSGTNINTGTTGGSAGTLKAGGSSAPLGIGTLALSGTGKLDLNGNSFSINGLTDVAGSFITDSSVTAGTSVLTINNAGTVASLVTNGANRNVGLTVTNANGSFVMTNTANTFSGGVLLANNTASGTRLNAGTVGTTVVNAGVIQTGPYGTGAITIGSSPTDRASIYFSAATTLANDIIFNTNLGADTGVTRFDAAVTLSGTITAGAAPILIQTRNAAGVVTLTGRLTSTGSNGLILGNEFGGNAMNVILNNLTANPNDYQGDTIVRGWCTLTLGKANQIPNGATVGNVVLQGGTLNLASFSDTINGLSGWGTVNNGTVGVAVLTLGDNNTNSVFSGTITNTAASLSLNKIGSGTVKLLNQSAITYSGSTTVTAGTLSLAGGGTIPAGAVSAYNFNNSDASDSVGTNNGSLVAAPTFPTGISINPGKALTLNGSSQYVTIPYSPTFALNTFTVSLWVNMANQPTTSTLFATRTNSDNTFDIQYNNGKLHSDIGNGTAWITTAADSIVPALANQSGLATANAQLPTGMWNMVTYVVTGTGYTIYINGIVVGSGSYALSAPLLMKTGQVMTIGAQGAGGGTIAGFANASFDEVRIYPTALSGAQVNALYTAGTGTLPTGTAVNLATTGTVLDSTNATQTIGSLAGVSGSSVLMGTGNLTTGGDNTTTTFSGVLSGTGTLTKAGATGVFTLDGTNTYSGTTAVTNGVLNANSNSALGTGSVTVATGSELALGNGVTVSGKTITILGNGNTAAIAGLDINRGALQARNGATATWSGPVILGASGARVGAQPSGTLTISGVISETIIPSNLNITADSLTGTVILSGANTYTGSTGMVRGTLKLGASNTLPNTLLDVRAFAGVTADQTAVDLNGFNQTVLAITTTANDGPGGSAGTILTNSSGTLGTLTINPAANAVYQGIVTGNLALVKNGTFTQRLSGTSPSTYTGTTTINDGVIQTGAVNALSPNSSVSLANLATAVLDLNSLSQVIGSLAGGGPSGGNVTLGSGTLTAGGDNSATSFGGGMTGTGGLIKQGTNVMTLTNTGILSHTGTTTISTGTLVVDGFINGTTGTTVESGATLRGTGNGSSSGTIATGTVTVNGKIFPGDTPNAGDAKGILTVAGLAVGPTGTVRVRVSGDSTVQTSDLLSVSGSTLTIDNTGSTLELSLALLNGSYNMSKTLISSTAGNPLTTSFANITVPNQGNGPSMGLTLDYQDISGTTQVASPQAVPVTATPVTLLSGANKVVLLMGNSVTPVKIADLMARAEGSGVSVTWTAVSEFQNAGFNVYRRALGESAWERVNEVLIGGRITNADEKKYSFFDWAPSGIFDYKLESLSIAGEREVFYPQTESVSMDWNNELSGEVSTVTADTVAATVTGFENSGSARKAEAAGVVFDAAAKAANGPMMKATSVSQFDAHTENVTAVSARAQTVSGAGVATMSSSAVGVRWFSSGSIGGSGNFNAAKVTYKTPGVMFIPQASMPAGYDLNRVSIQREGRNIQALSVTDAGALVYAPGYSDDYTDKDVLFVRRSTAATKTGTQQGASGLFGSAQTVNVTTKTSATAEFHDVYFDFGSQYRPFSFAPWFSYKYLTQGSAQDFTINLPAASSDAGKLTVNVWSLTSSDNAAPDHGMQLLINGQAVGEASWDGGGKMMQLSYDVPAGVLVAGDNAVRLVTPTISGVNTQTAFLHSITTNYTRALDGSKPFEIVNSSNAAQLYELYNVPAGGAWVVDARFTDRAALVATETQAQADGSLRMRFVAAAGGSGKFVVAPAGQESQPLSIVSRQVRALKLNGTYLATGPAQFSSGVQPLLTKRSREGIRSTYIDQEQLFDYYNFGRYGPDGIRKAVRAVKPTYLLLVGRTTYDYRNYEGKNIDPLCPAYLVSTSFWAQTTSDSAFGDLGRGYPEVAVGRLPVNNTTELSGVINHIISYQGIPQSGMRVHAVADQPDPLTADFGAQLDTLIKAYNPDVSWQENYLLRTYPTSPEVTNALKNAANGGAEMILYSGHGNAARLGNNAPNILDQTSVQQWTGNVVFLQATCTANWMAKNVDDYKSIAIQALTQPQGGISASIGTSTYMNSDVAVSFMNQLLKNTNKSARWGSVLLNTQQWAGRQTKSPFYKDLMNTEQLFGDPAMPVNAPKSSATTQNSPAAGTF